MNNLPPPHPEAQAVSQHLCKLIQERIHAHNGWIRFADFMQAALYTPAVGYYSGGNQKFAEGGDFTTAPEMGSLFAECLANACALLLTPQQDAILEIGAGSGKLACDLLKALEQRKKLPMHYYILEISTELRARQQARVAQECPHLLTHVHWLDQLPPAFNGIMIGNEVLDAMPAHLILWDKDNIQERGVTLQDGQFTWQDAPIDQPELLTLAHTIQEQHGLTAPYLSEISLANRGFMRSLAQCLQSGWIFLFDYGFTAREYYHPQRNQGTLMCHYQHHSHTDPLTLVGIQDITTHVDFTAIAEAGYDAGLEVLCYSNQTQWLLNQGLAQALAQNPSPQRQAEANQLISPAEMGELFKIIAFSKQVQTPAIFTQGDKAHTL